MKRILALTAMVVAAAVLAGPAAAQKGGIMSQGNHKDPLQLQYEREKADQEANEKAYNEQMKRMRSPAPTGKVDPWAGVRQGNETNAKR